jgi:hypothetical protein
MDCEVACTQHEKEMSVQSNRRQRYAQGAQLQTGVDEAVLAALSDADRAAVLAAMSGSEQSHSSVPVSGASTAEELPKFDCQGSTDQLQVPSPSCPCKPCCASAARHTTNATRAEYIRLFVNQNAAAECTRLETACII